MLRLFFFPLLVLLLVGCQPAPSSSDEVVCETVHRYGVALEPDDWSARGKDGQIVSMRKDGSTVTRSYEGGVLHGECTYTFPYRSVVQKREVYDQGTLLEEKIYYPHGEPQKHIIHQAPTVQLIHSWYEKGAPRCQEVVEGGLLKQGEYYNFQHQLESRVDDFQGIRTCRGSLGQLESIDTIQEGQMAWRATYHPNGMPETLTPYVNGEIEGARRTFLLGGEPATLEEWVQNLQHGVTTLFAQGEKVAEVPYVNGCKQGIEKRYREGEVVVQEISWVQGHRHGPTQFYMGGTLQTDWYFRGRQVPNQASFELLCNP